MKKIIRDKLNDDQAKNGIQSVGYHLNLQEAIPHMKAKLVEEAEEVTEATNQEELTEELGDVLEVIEGIARAAGIPYEAIEKAKKNKREEKGGFETYYYVEHVTLAKDHPKVAYLLANSHKYPEVKS